MSETKISDKQEDFIADPYKIVPKFCNGVNFTALNNNKIIFTFTYKEDNQQTILIDRVIIDKEHAVNIKDVLTNFLIDLDKKNDTSTT